MTDCRIHTTRTDKTALVLGASGSIGSAVADALAHHGWTVRALVRDPARAAASWRGDRQVDWQQGDAMVRDEVVAAAEGAALIVHAVSPPGYRNWDKFVLPMIDNTIVAAREVGARILLPGTVYNFDPATTPVIRPETPQHPRSRKGAIRVELERRLAVASTKVPTLIVRAGDYYGPRLRSSWFAQAMVRPGHPVERIVTLARDVGHTWAYLPDLAETMVRLVESPHVGGFERIGFEGFWDPDGKAFPALVAAAAGTTIKQRSFPWWAIRLAAPCGGFCREAVDILPSWQHPVRIDNSRLVQLLGEEPRTPTLLSMQRTLQGLGCLPIREPIVQGR